MPENQDQENIPYTPPWRFPPETTPEFSQSTTAADQPKSSNKWPISLFVTFCILALLGVGGFLFRDKIPFLASSSYSLPDNLTYSEKPGWQNIPSGDCRVSVKEDWGLKPLTGTSEIYYNKPIGDEGSLAVSLSQGSKTFTEELADINGQVDEAYKNPNIPAGVAKPKLFKSQSLTINGYNAKALFFNLGTKGLFSIHVVVDKNGRVCHLIIATVESFYRNNKKDIENLIGSFR